MKCISMAKWKTALMDSRNGVTAILQFTIDIVDGATTSLFQSL